MVKVILKEGMDNLGEAGDVVDVKPGYARNYLLPQGIAYEASEANVRRLEQEKQRAEERAKRDYLEARRRASQLDGASLTFQARASEEGRLFGSVTGGDITDRLGELDLDFEVDKRWVQLDEPLKELGAYKVAVRLHPEVEEEIEVRIDREED